MTEISIVQGAIRQRTLKNRIACVGRGLHSGVRVNLALAPAPCGTGIVFRRTDLGLDIPARHDHVSDTRLSTGISHPDHPRACVRTIEHLMAALSATGIDNAIVEVDGPEIPILDGSAAPFLFLIDCAGRVEQNASRKVLEILQPVRVEQGEAFAELRPGPFAGAAGLELAVSIDFAAEIIGRQALSLNLTERAFRAMLAQARTFTLLSEIESLKAAGLARGGSLRNAVVVDGARVMNPEGLRASNEFVRHKMLDAVGDLAMAGAPIQGRFVAHRTGHALNARLLQSLFATPAAWRLVSAENAGWSAASYEMRAEAA